MTDLETLRAAYRSSAADDGDHLSEATWERLACGELSADERGQALAHVVRCSLCADVYRAVQEIGEGAAEFDPGASSALESGSDRSPRVVPWRGLGLLAMAATVLLAVVLPLRRDHAPAVDGGSPLLRSAEAPVEVIGVDPVDRVVEWGNGDVTLVWSVEPAPAEAFVEVLDGDGELVWTSPPTADTRVDWPAAAIPGPGRYYWRAVLTAPADGGVASDLTSFELSASSP